MYSKNEGFPVGSYVKVMSLSDDVDVQYDIHWGNNTEEMFESAKYKWTMRVEKHNPTSNYILLDTRCWYPTHKLVRVYPDVHILADEEESAVEVTEEPPMFDIGMWRTATPPTYVQFDTAQATEPSSW